MGGYRPVLKKLTILGRMNDINIQAEFEIEYDPEQIRFITMLSDFTEKLRLGGVMPPVGKPTIERKWSDNVTNARGEHPLDKLPRLNEWGEPYLCPTCKSPQQIIEGIAKTGTNAGNKYRKAICPNSKSCGWQGTFINSKES